MRRIRNQEPVSKGKRPWLEVLPSSHETPTWFERRPSTAPPVATRHGDHEGRVQ